MKFLPRCPKCSSPNTDMYRDTTASPRMWPHDAVFHCRCCGNRLFGKTAVDYTDKLFIEHREELQKKAAEAAKKAAEAARKEAAERAAARKAAEMKRREALFEAVKSSVCAWDPCSEPRRSASKYCSRNCSNKNARARHQARKTA